MSDEKGTTPVFELNLIRRDLPADPAAEKRKQDREDGRQKALEYANDALCEMVTLMRTCPDPKIRLQAAKNVMDRAWGTPKAVEGEAQALKNRSIIEVLAAISADIQETERAAAKITQEPPVVTIEKQEDVLDAILLQEDTDDQAAE